MYKTIQDPYFGGQSAVTLRKNTVKKREDCCIIKCED